MNDLDNRPQPLDEQVEGDHAPRIDERDVKWIAATSSEVEIGATEFAADSAPPSPPALPATLTQRFLPLIIAAAVLFLDQITKGIVEVNIPLYQSWAPVPAIQSLFRVTHATNTGAAFGLFQGGGWFFGIMAGIVAVAIIYYSLTLPRGHNLLRLALGLQLGGALGNLFDRIQLGHVTDFLDFGPWPIFNLADTAVVSGVLLLAWMMFHEERELREAQRREGGREAESVPTPSHSWPEASNEQSTQINTD